MIDLAELVEKVKGHTPGPWEYILGTGFDVFDVAESHVVCRGWNSYRPKLEADARLIAAAPELLTLALEQAQEIKRLKGAILWALGGGEDFRARAEGEGAYWWRTELRKRSGL
jgi:hypothetical protein